MLWQGQRSFYKPWAARPQQKQELDCQTLARSATSFAGVRAQKMSRRLVVFDLDETLVHARTERLSIEHKFQIANYFVYVRPYLDELLEFSSQKFDLAVWSSSSAQYVEAVVSNIFGSQWPLKFAWSVNKCVQRVDLQSNGYVYIKDLRKIQSHGYTVEQISIVDDSPEKIARQPKNLIAVKPFNGDPSDRELLILKSKLEAL